MNINKLDKHILSLLKKSILRSRWHTVIPGLDPESNMYTPVIKRYSLDSGPKPGMTVCHRFLRRRLL